MCSFTIRLIFILAVFLSSTGAVTANDALRILPLGDSITQGASWQPSYRKTLWLMLKEHGINVDFVGSNREVYNDTGGVSGDFDQDHEGHWGFEINQILDALPDWLTMYSADIALIHLGTNDFDRGESSEVTLSELKLVLDLLRMNNPKITVLLAEIIPMRFKSTRRFNTALRQWAPRQTTPTSEVIVVDQNSGYYSLIDNYDKYHPNNRGQRKIAKRWFDAILKVIE